MLWEACQSICKLSIWGMRHFGQRCRALCKRNSQHISKPCAPNMISSHGEHRVCGKPRDSAINATALSRPNNTQHEDIVPSSMPAASTEDQSSVRHFCDAEIRRTIWREARSVDQRSTIVQISLCNVCNRANAKSADRKTARRQSDETCGWRPHMSRAHQTARTNNSPAGAGR